MKKIIILLGFIFIISNSFAVVILKPEISFYRDRDSTFKERLERRDTIITFLDGIKKGINLNSKTLKNSIQLHVERQDSIIKSLKHIKESINSNRDTLQNTINVGFEAIQKKPADSIWNFGSLLGSILGALLGGGVAISIFVQGRKNEKKKEHQKLIDYGEEVYTLIKNIVVNSKQQVELLNELIASIREKAYTHGSYQHISFNLLKRAQSFNTTYTFNTFKSLSVEKKSYIKFYTSIDYLLEFFTNVDDDYNKNNSEIITPLSNNFVKLRQEIFTLGTNYIEQKRREEKTTDPLYLYVNKLVMDYYSSPTLPDAVDLKYDVEMLIRPLKIELLANFRNYDLSNDLLNLVKQAGDIYTTIIQENSKFANVLADQMDSVNNMISRLEQIETELKIIYPS